MPHREAFRAIFSSFITTSDFSILLPVEHPTAKITRIYGLLQGLVILAFRWNLSAFSRYFVLLESKMAAKAISGSRFDIVLWLFALVFPLRHNSQHFEPISALPKYFRFANLLPFSNPQRKRNIRQCFLTRWSRLWPSKIIYGHYGRPM